MTAPDAAQDRSTPRGPGGAGAEAPAAIDRRMLEALVCPVTHAPLRYDPERQELVSRAANLAFPVRDGIPVMLVSEARPLD